MTVLIKNIRQLCQVRDSSPLLRGEEMSILPSLQNAWVLLEDGIIAAYGTMEQMPDSVRTIRQTIDANGGTVLPAWCDSHSHIVFDGSRELEFVDKIRGLTYAEIAARGGGILHSAARLHEASEDDLYRQAWTRLEEVSRQGTGALEIKSGYGLTVEDELKMLRVIRRLQKDSPVEIKSTFLGAHTYPIAFRGDHQGYIRQIIDEMLPVIARDKLADYIDVFCEEGFFSTAEAEEICRAGMQYGLRPKIHANQLSLSGGVELGVKLGALSVDHLETMDEAAINTLAASDTIGTLLPLAAFFLRMPFQPARELIRAGAAIALASDFNPGSSPSGNMNLVVSMACIQMKMLPEEAVNAATLNGAHAMELGSCLGSVTVGKKAHLILTKPIPSLAFMPYAFGTNHIRGIILGHEQLLL